MRHLVHFLLLFGLPVAAVGIALTMAAILGEPARTEGEARVDPYAAAMGVRLHVPPRQRTARVRAARTQEQLALEVAVIATAAAGVIHAGVTKVHFDEYWLYGVFFLASAVVQLGWASVALRRPSRFLIILAAVGNAVVIGLWILTRTVGVPLGPGAGEVEAAGAADVASSLYELVAVLACIYLLRSRAREITRPSIGIAEVSAAVVVLGTALVLSLVGHG